MTQLFVTRAELIPLGESTEDHKISSEEEANLIERDRLNPDPRNGGLFRGCFKSGSLTAHPPIRDDEDGVTRCPNCAWELEDGFCSRCHVRYDIDGVPYDADSLDWSEDDDDSNESLGFHDHHHRVHSVSDDEDGLAALADLGDSEGDISLDEDGNSVHTASEGYIGRGEFTFARNTANELLHNRLSRRHFNSNRISRRRYASSLPPNDGSSQAENEREREYEEGNDEHSNLSVPADRSDEDTGSLDQLAIDDNIKYGDGTDDEPSTCNFSPILGSGASDDEPQDTYSSELGHESGTSITNSDDQEINDEYASDGHMHNGNSDYSESETDTTIGQGYRLRGMYRQISNRQQRIQPITTSESEAEGSPRQALRKERVTRHSFRPNPRVSSRVNNRIVAEQSDSDHPVRNRKRRIVLNESSSDDPISDVEPNHRYKRNRNISLQHVVDV